MREYCGIFGVYTKSEKAGTLIKKGLFHLQHRGQESAGIVTSDDKEFHTLRNFGLVTKALPDSELGTLNGHLGIGHTRYSTAGDKDSFNNIQPICFFAHYRNIALAHNGNLTNADSLKRTLIQDGRVFYSTSDSEVILHIYAKNLHLPVVERMKEIDRLVKGAYSILILENDTLIAYRDRHGTRPLLMGKKGKDVAFSSEEGALRINGFNDVRELLPGELVVVNKNGIESFRIADDNRKNQCVFELIYFARPDGHLFGKSVYEFRRKSGRLLAKRENEDIDIVIPVPDSGVMAALGYSEESDIPLEFGFIRNHYVGRSFISPYDREEKVRMKLIPVRSVVEGKSIALIDDSIVRGTTSGKIISLLRENGAKEVHMRIASPPVRYPCFFGIDIPTREELIANNREIDEVKNLIGADSLMYLSLEDLYSLTSPFKNDFCYACFRGDHLYRPET